MLRLRLGLLVAATLLTALTGAAVLTVRLFESHQTSDIRGLLERELQRVTDLMVNPAVDESLLEHGDDALLLQFVAFGGEVVAPIDSGQPLPSTDETGWVDYQGGKVIALTSPWVIGSGLTIGTVRIGYRGDAALATQAALRRDLVRAGVVIALGSLVLALALLGRELRPLARLAEEATSLDPADPRFEPPKLRRDEVGRVGQALSDAVAAIRDRKREERDALAVVAHELAAPLTVVVGQLDSLATDPQAEPRLLAARDAARELLATSQDLMVLAKGDLGLRLEFNVTSLAEVADRVCREFPGVVFVREDPGMVLAAPDRLAQVARNLIRNAVQACGSAQCVRVRVALLQGEVADQPGQVLLEVSDDGPGLTPERMERVFDRHFTARAAEGGSGLGLSVVRYLVEMHGGSVEVDSAPGKGAKFTVMLRPLASEIDAGG